ncbi:MAG: gamma-glutamyltransferase [Planctomycetota bacterium]
MNVTNSARSFCFSVVPISNRWCRGLVVLLVLVLVGCGPARLRLDAGVVVSPEPQAARVGADVLRRGGNAVDAAIAVQFALAVTYPTAGNIGGGGFMLIHGETKREGWLGRSKCPDMALDYRETAPAKAHRDMYLNADGKVTANLSLQSHLAAGVPGTVMGMWEAHSRYGRLPWAELLKPAIALARDGFELDAWTAHSFAEQQAETQKRESRYRAVSNFAAYFHGKPGERLRQPELAEALHRIAMDGPAGFYEGPTAKLIVDEMQRGGGLITADDLKSYRVKWRTPIEGRYRGHRVVSMPPPSSGGIALIQMLTMFEAFERPLWGTTAHLHLVAEIEKRVFADRSVYGGDPDFVKVPAHELIDSDYCKRRAADVNKTSRSNPATIEAGRVGIAGVKQGASLNESPQTTHYSIVDRDGMAVSTTTTLNDGYGSGIVVTGAGFLLNNEMDDFSAKPGERNMYGVTGGSANAIAPGKRMLSSMAPTFVFKPDGRLWLVLGTPGGPTIFTTVFQVVTNKIDYAMSMQEAVDAARFHHQWPPPTGSDPIKVDATDSHHFGASTSKDLEAMGYTIKHVSGIGDVQAIEIDGNHVIGASDRRGIGRAERE